MTIPDDSSIPLTTNSNTTLWGWEDYDVTDHVQQIVNGNVENFGYSIINSTEGNGAFFRSSEYEEIELRPKLTIEYDSKTSKSYLFKDNYFNSTKNCTVEIINMHGQTIKTFKTNNFENINNQIPKGFHLIRIYSKNKKIAYKSLSF